MKTIFSNQRSKWIFVIGLIAIGSGLTVKHIISFPTACGNEEKVSLTNNKRIDMQIPIQ